MSSTLKVSTSPLPGSRIALEVGVPGSRCQASYEAALLKLGRTVKLAGFRQGKVPRSVLLQQIGPLRVKATALEELVDAVLRDALSQENLEALGQPELSGGFDTLLEQFEPGKELLLKLEMDVPPTPKLKTTKGLKAEAQEVLYNPERIDELLEQSRKQLATLVPISDRAAAMGDVAVVSFSGSFSDTNEPISGGSAESLEVELEEGRMIPGFVEGIVGLKLGAETEVNCEFPSDYQDETCRGRAAKFKISLNDLKAKELPTLDDAFAQQASDKETLEELRAELETRLKADAEKRQKQNREQALLKALVAELEVEIPESLVKEEINAMLQETAAEMAQQGLDIKKLFTPEVVRNLASKSRPEATERLQSSLALQALAKAEAISVDAAVLEAKMKEVIRGLSDTNRIDQNRLRAAVSEDLLKEAVFAWLEANASITIVGAEKPAESPKSKAKPKAKAKAID
ncbi:trigger factor [Synechococcus sp. UW140]|uniref:trigger factor n=1 Tax=Synechococcus sp. UW140 TaxID=368503 RepID=UPI003137F019